MPRQIDPSDAARRPVDRTAARVISKGAHFQLTNADQRFVMSRDPLPIVAPRNETQRALIGRKFGRFTVRGVSPVHSGASGATRALYVCRCACGMHEHRSYKAINNPQNTKDACRECRTIANRRMYEWNRRTGEQKVESDFL